jgi:hypothetical protein
MGPKEDIPALGLLIDESLTVLPVKRGCALVNSRRIWPPTLAPEIRIISHQKNASAPGKSTG